MAPPKHHKEIANHLRDLIAGDPKVTVFRDDHGKRPVTIGEFGPSKKRLYSTIGESDKSNNIPEGNFEFASCGSLKWLPNAVASSIYWLKDRECTEWPLICEDVIRHNVKSTYRHIAYVPSIYSLKLSTGSQVKWLLGVPITDNEIGLSFENAMEKACSIYPDFMFNQ
jgi:hypothetical protein